MSCDSGPLYFGNIYLTAISAVFCAVSHTWVEHEFVVTGNTEFVNILQNKETKRVIGYQFW